MNAATLAGLLTLAWAGISSVDGEAATLFGLVSTGELYESTDQGESWSVVAILPVRDAVALAAGASRSELYLAGRSGGIYRSTDAGIGWSTVGAVTAGDVADLIVAPDLAVLVLTASGGLYRSGDAGATFTPISALTGSDFVSLTVTAPRGRYYALSRSGDVYESRDAGFDWALRGALTLSNAIALRSAGGTLYALTATGDVYRSEDAGASWLGTGTLSQSGMTSFTRDGATLVASTAAGEVATSADGAAWTWRGVINQLTVTALANDIPATTSVELPGGAGAFALSLPWPNPARAGAAVTLRLDLAVDDRVDVVLYDVAGRRVWARGPDVLAAGTHDITLRPPSGVAGIHFLAVEAAGGRRVRRLALLE